MAKSRGREHTSLTETATEVVRVLERLDGIKMIAPGVIASKRTAATRYLTAVVTRAGLELIVTGQGVQKIAVHLSVYRDPTSVITELRRHKRLQHFTVQTRERKPGV